MAKPFGSWPVRVSRTLCRLLKILALKQALCFDRAVPLVGSGGATKTEINGARAGSEPLSSGHGRIFGVLKYQARYETQADPGN